jgi:hypothetical protein
MYGIGYGTSEYFMYHLCSFLWHESQCIESIFDWHSSDDIGNHIEFLGRDSDVASRGFHRS